VHQNGLVEIIDGVTENDTIVVDGAGFLTDKALVKLSVNPTQAHTKKVKN